MAKPNVHAMGIINLFRDDYLDGGLIKMKLIWQTNELEAPVCLSGWA